MSSSGSKIEPLCLKCKIAPMVHKRAKLCSNCYKIKRKEDWKFNEIKRQELDPKRKERLLKYQSEQYYKKYRATRLVNKKCIECEDVALKGSIKSLCRLCSNISAKKRKVKYQLERKKKHLPTRIRENIKSRIKHGLNGKCKTNTVIDYLGCSIKELKKHLESQFVDNMTWDNYGFYGWHIDHIRPLASFDLTKEEELKKACHYTNLQPMWAKDNFKKGDKVE